jgi:hypothetical protein
MPFPVPGVTHSIRGASAVLAAKRHLDGLQYTATSGERQAAQEQAPFDRVFDKRYTKNEKSIRKDAYL